MKAEQQVIDSTKAAASAVIEPPAENPYAKARTMVQKKLDVVATARAALQRELVDQAAAMELAASMESRSDDANWLGRTQSLPRSADQIRSRSLTTVARVQANVDIGGSERPEILALVDQIGILQRWEDYLTAAIAGLSALASPEEARL